MSFLDICTCAGIFFFLSLAASLIRCLCIFKHKGHATPDNPLFDPFSCILYGILCAISFPVSVPMSIIRSYVSSFEVKQALHEQREEYQKLDEITRRTSYEAGQCDGYKEGRQCGRSDGFKDGYRYGYNSGYHSGYKDGHFGYESDPYCQVPDPCEYYFDDE